MKIKNLNLYMNILKIVLVAVGVILCMFLFTGPNATSGSAEDIAKFRDGSEMSLSIGFTTIVLALGVGLVLLFFVVQLISNPKKTIISIIGIVAALVVYLIFYAAGTDDTNESLQLRYPVSKDTIVTTTAGLWTTFVAICVAFLAVLAGFFTRLIK